MTTEPKWLLAARNFHGLTEIAGPRHNKQIVQFWKDIGMGGIKDDETPWCGAFVTFCLQVSGIKAPNTGRALDFMNWGKPCDAAVGSVAVFSRSGGGHVGFVAGRNASGHLMILGGNQGNAVNIRAFDPASARLKFLGCRWPKNLALPDNTGITTLPILAGTHSIGTVV